MRNNALFRRLLISGTCLWVAILALVPYLILLAASFLERGTDTLVRPGLTLTNYLNLLDPAIFGILFDAALTGFPKPPQGQRNVRTVIQPPAAQPASGAPAAPAQPAASVTPAAPANVAPATVAPAR